jgi:hypothetical protein
MKRYAVFGSPCYDQLGGWNDFMDAFDEVDAAIACAKEYQGPRSQNSYWRDNWAQVIDLETFKEVEFEPQGKAQ